MVKSIGKGRKQHLFFSWSIKDGIVCLQLNRSVLAGQKNKIRTVKD